VKIRFPIASARLYRMRFWLVFCSVIFGVLATFPTLAAPAFDTNYGVGSWIWDKQTKPQQLCRFWREFDIPKSDPVRRAVMEIAADNTFLLFLDGREIGRGGDWADVTEYDVTQVLEPGPHVLAVEAFNDFDAAGVLAGLRISFLSGRVMEIGTDTSWKIVPSDDKALEKLTHSEPSWPAATIVGKFGDQPWGTPRRVIKADAVAPVKLRFWQEGWFQIALLSVCGVAMIICVRQAGKLAIQSQSQQMVRRERNRIARDIHDDLTARLTQLILLSEVVQGSLPPGSEPCEQIRRISDKARELSRSMNEIIWLVNSQRDTLRDFASFVCKYTQTFLEPTAICCRFDLDEEMPETQFDLGVRRNLYLAVKESLNNVVRHSHATEVTLRIRQQGSNLLVAVEDNGKGFDPALADHGRNGLSNVIKRAADAHGVCQLISQPGAGCRVEIVIPLAPPSRNHFSWLTPRSTTPSPGKTPELAHSARSENLTVLR
jgi:signal transduction histidine kinase